MANTPQEKSELAKQATAVDAECKQLEAQFNMLQRMEQNLEKIASYKVQNKKMLDDIEKKIADLKIQIPKQ